MVLADIASPWMAESIASIEKNDYVTCDARIYSGHSFNAGATGEQCNRIKVSFQSRARRRHLEQGLVAEPVAAGSAASALFQVRSDGWRFQLRQRVQEPGLGRCQEGSCSTDDGLAELVACGLRSLWAFIH